VNSLQKAMLTVVYIYKAISDLGLYLTVTRK